MDREEEQLEEDPTADSDGEGSRPQKSDYLKVGCLAIMAVVGSLVIIISLGLLGELTGNNSGQQEDITGGLCSAMPDPYQGIFQKAGAKYKVDPAFLGAIFYGGEHGSSWPSASGPWATSKAGAEGPFQFMPATWASYQEDGDGDGNKEVQNLTDSAFAAAHLLANLGAAGNGVDENDFREAAAKYNGGTNPPKFSYEVYAKNVLNAFRQFSCVVGGACGKSIIDQAAKYDGIPYSQAVHCGANTFGPSGVPALDCSGYVSRVYRDLSLFPKGTCYDTLAITNSKHLQEIKASEIKMGDVIISDVIGDQKGGQAHAVIYISGNVNDRFMVWQEGGDQQRVHRGLRSAKPNQRFFRSKNCNQ